MATETLGNFADWCVPVWCAGVMRFLQLEWHAHERARNSWDIERAEMKAKIAKQEGEVRHAKRINEQLDRQVRMLEMALKNERAKARKLAKGQAGTAGDEAKKEKDDVEGKGNRLKAEVNGEDDKGKESGRPEGERMHRRAQATSGVVLDDEAGGMLTLDAATSNVPHNSFLETSDELTAEQTEKEREQYLDNTTKYLKNCMKEIQYLLTPPHHPPPPQLVPNGSYAGLPEAPLSVEDIYARNQQLRQQRQHSLGGQSLPVPTSMQGNVQQPLGGLPQTQHQMQQQGYREYGDVSQPPDGLQEGVAGQQPFEEPAEVISHTFDSRGREITTTTEQSQPVRPQARQQPQADADGWTFEEEQPLPPSERGPDMQVSRRPDTDLFPSAANANNLPPAKSPPRSGPGSHRRKNSGSQPMGRRRSSQGKTSAGEAHADEANAVKSHDPSQFRVKFALRGHLDVVRSVIFSGGGSPSEPEVCTAGDDGTIKRWIVPASYQNFGQQQQPHHQHNAVPDLDISAYFTHRGHDGVVTSLAACPALTGFSTGGRANGDGWIFSGGQDATVRVWERGRVDPKATLEGHTDAVWAVCVLPAPVGVVFGQQASANFGSADRLVLVSGSADGSVKVWAVSAPPQQGSGGGAGAGSRRGVGGSRRHSVTSGSNFPSSPQPSVASSTPFSYTLVHTISRPAAEGGRVASPTSIAPLSPTGETFVVAYTDSSVLVFDTRTGEEVIGMASNETYDGTMGTSINAVVATSLGLEGSGPSIDAARGREAEEVGGGATGGREGVEGVVISGHEDRFVRFFDANSGTLRPLPGRISLQSLVRSANKSIQANVLTRCSRTRQPSPRSPSAPTAGRP